MKQTCPLHPSTELVTAACPDADPGCQVLHSQCPQCHLPTPTSLQDFLDARGNLAFTPPAGDLVVSYKLHSADAKVPTYAHEGDAGADLYATHFSEPAFPTAVDRTAWNHYLLNHPELLDRLEPNVAYTVLIPGQSVVCHTELSLSPPMGWEVSIRGRSGLAFKHGVVIMHVGTGDAGFTGRYDVLLKNESSRAFVLKAGDRIAQVVFSRVGRAAFRPSEMPKTERGDRGYGSSGGLSSAKKAGDCYRGCPSCDGSNSCPCRGCHTARA